jgi:hypothetical protein
MQQKSAPLITPYVDLAPRNHVVADGAGSLVIKRNPFSMVIGRPQKLQPIFRCKLFLHA